MTHRMLHVAAVTVIVIAPIATLGQSPTGSATTKPTTTKAATAKAWAAPRTSWGDPDLQGVWNDATSTPLQRPGGVGDKVVGDEEAAEFQNGLEFNLTRDRRDGGAEVDVNRAYNEHWMDARRLKITADRRTSLIIDPPDGRIPPLVPLTPERQRARAAGRTPSRGSMPGCPTAMKTCRCRCAASYAPILRRTYRRSTTTTFKSSRVPVTW